MTWITIQIHIFVSSKFQKRHLSTTSDYIVLIRYSELEPYKLQWLQIHLLLRLCLGMELLILLYSQVSIKRASLLNSTEYY